MATPDKLAGILNDVSGPATDLVDAQTALQFAVESENRQDLDHHLADAEQALRDAIWAVKKLRARIRFIDRKNDDCDADLYPDADND